MLLLLVLFIEMMQETITIIYLCSLF